ncbi:MAG: hypothetical protein JO130_17320 [Solirubrobacterales bacterium]|nr:hypothetical protein [Solirubrobacterales bacterium]
MSTFEDRLWSELVDVHGDEMRFPPSGARRRRPALLTGTALAAVAAAAAVLVFTAGTTAPPAYAVTTNADGTVTVTLNDIVAITAVNAELARDGVAAKAIPITSDCPVHGFPNPMPAGTDPNTYTVTIDPRQIPAGYTAVVGVAQTPAGKIELAQAAFRSAIVPACFNVTPMVLVPRKP